MNLRLRKEEYAPLADFLRVSFVRDQAVIQKRFPKMNAAFLADFDEKITIIKNLESGIVLTEEQKNATGSLYEEANSLNTELNFLSRYMKDAGLNSAAVSELKEALRKNNIEGAVLLIRSVKQFVEAHNVVLQEEGMEADFASILGEHATSLSGKNTLQNELINTRKKLTETNKVHYDGLYKMLVKITNTGKLVFSSGKVRDEYVMSKVTSRMRVLRASKGNDSKDNGSKESDFKE